jgi:hypothetical protein
MCERRVFDRKVPLPHPSMDRAQHFVTILVANPHCRGSMGCTTSHAREQNGSRQ